jgi:hypothetical protein
MDNKETKRCLSLLETPGIKILLREFLKVSEQELTGERVNEGDDAMYADVTELLYKKLKMNLKKSMQVASIVPQQRDLEELIQSIKDGKEK